jgi:3-deoxy-D-manno-octulosonic-acid transferase
MSRLVDWLLNVAYLIALSAAMPWLLYKAATTRKYRSGLAQKFLGLVPRRTGNRPCVWLHAVSVGEVNLLTSLLKELVSRAPGVECVISTTTLTGYELARGKFAQHCVFYCPLDFSWAVRNALDRIRPDLLVLAELELWPNLIRLARRRGARVAIVNGRLSDGSFRGYRRIRPLIEPLLEQVDLVAAQTEEYASRFVALGAPEEHVRVTGSIKFDGARFDRDNSLSRELAKLSGIGSADVVFLAGSTGAPEEAMALDTYRQLASRFANLKLVLAPRHPERFDEVARLLFSAGVEFVRRTELDGRTPPATSIRVVLVDTVGELAAWWGLAQIAFVGGSLNNRGGQNMIEPAAFGAAVCFGPNTRNFRDVVKLLLAAGAAQVVQGEAELTTFVERCLRQGDFGQSLGRRAAEVVRQQQGASARSAELLLPLLGGSVSQRAATRLSRVA